MDYEISVSEKEKRFIFTISSRDHFSMSEITDEISSLASIKKIEIKS
jgi:hypothetical protein